ncbi:hypothetical protein ABW19_dt0201888 [Dactylella cylindrospora]|nr:hypothetical protein ABW19_dt0201888 [Dactylella cylindrospora]
MKTKYRQFLILLKATLSLCLGDDPNWGSDKTIVEYTTPEGDLYYVWEGLIRAQMLGDFKCLANPAPHSDLFYPVNMADCPADRDKAIDQDHGVNDFRWYIKGRVVLDVDKQPVFECYIRSSRRGQGNPPTKKPALCLSSYRSPSDTPKFKKEGSQRPWKDDETYDITYDIESVRAYKQLETSWGPVFLDQCNPWNENQIWYVGLAGSQFEGDPQKWTCHRRIEARNAETYIIGSARKTTGQLVVSRQNGVLPTTRRVNQTTSSVQVSCGRTF